jgi:hypothetical protein
MFLHCSLRTALLTVFLSLVACVGLPPVASASSAASFRPVNPDELKMASEPAAPGAPAVILYREVYRDDSGRVHHEEDYFRIKILTDEGRKYADIEIPYDKDQGSVSGVHARTIKPDGSIVDYDGKVFTKSVVKAKGFKYLAKTFSLPAIQVGCVIEYYYLVDLS